MSYDVHFSPCRGVDGKTKKMKNPFTGEEMAVRAKKPLAAAELEAVRDTLLRHGAKAKGEGYTVRFAGGSAEVFAEKLEEGGMFAIRGALGPALAQLLFDVMVAGDWVFSAGDEPLLIASTPERAKAAEAEHEGTGVQVVVAASPEEVTALLSGGFKAWAAYRDKATGR